MGRTYGIDDRYSRVVVHILRAVNETTGGYREFAVWRAEHIKYEKNIVFVCGTRAECDKKNFSGMEIVWGNGNIRQTRQKMKEICSVCYEKKIPLVFHLQQPGAIRDIARACVGLNIRKNMLYTMKSTFSGYTDKKAKFNCITAALYAKDLTFLSHASYKDYPRWITLLKRGNISIIEHGACKDEIKKIDWNKRKSIPKKPLQLIYVARLVPVKNHMFLLDIADKLEDICILFIGGGQQYPVIQKEIAKRHLEDKIRVTGSVSREEVYEMLGQGDVYISPSKVEGLPVSVLEAMHIGLPIILSDIEPHIELAQKTKGIMILPMEKKVWINKLNDLRHLKIEELAQLGEKNAEAANRCYTLDRMHKRYSRLYSSLE